jgi:hypothetical protein
MIISRGCILFAEIYNVLVVFKWHVCWKPLKSMCVSYTDIKSFTSLVEKLKSRTT